MAYYDGTKLLSLKDINDQQPEIYILVGNRTGGKTTFFNRMLVNHVLKKGTKFMLIFRYQSEMEEIADKFFKDIGPLFFPDMVMEAEKKSKGLYYNLYIRKKAEEAIPIHAGYAVSLNSADKLKRFSHLFSDVSEMLFDEFQSETNQYLGNEITRFLSLHTTVARGQGEMVRRVPVYMLSNTVSLINPYFVKLGISNRITKNTRFLKGNGYVMEVNVNLDAAKAQESSSFNKAFAGHKYLEMAKENLYLNDNMTFIDKIDGASKYVATIKYEGVEYGIRKYEDKGLLHVSTSVDKTSRFRITVGVDDFSESFLMVSSNAFLIIKLRAYFTQGCMRFQNQMCKDAFLKAINIY